MHVQLENAYSNTFIHYNSHALPFEIGTLTVDPDRAKPAMSNPRPSQRFCAAKFKFSL